MIESVQPSSVTLPARLQGQFDALRSRLWRIETATVVALAFSVLAVSGFALFVSDRVWETPKVLRALFTAAGLAGFAWLLLRWLQLWVFRPRDQRALAVLVQKRYRRLGDRLLGVVELADEQRRPQEFSPALYRAAIEQVAGEAEQYDFPDAVATTRVKKVAWTAAGLAAIGVLLLVLSPAAFLNAASRWIAPLSDSPRFTLVQLEGLPRERVVAHGEPFAIDLELRYRSLWHPRRALARLGAQPAVTARAQGTKLRFPIPGQVQAGILTIRAGDARGQVRIDPQHRPSLQAVRASVQLPAYLQYPTAEEDLEGGSLSLVDGSQVVLSGKASRDLASAELRLPDKPTIRLPVEGQAFRSELLDLEGVPEIALAWKDNLGLDTAAPWRLRVEFERDSPPTPQLKDLLRDTAILETEVLDLKAAARDDFGVRELGVEWQVFSGDISTNSAVPRRLSANASGPREKALEEIFHFSPRELGVPPDSVVEVRGFATDYYPGRDPSETAVYRVHVLGNERHAELVRQNLESLLSRLEEVTRLEEKLTASTREVAQLSDETLAEEKAGERLAAAEQEQNENAAQLDQLSEEGKKTLREAFRNPVFSEESLRDWAKNLQQMQQLSANQMSKASQALQSAQKNRQSRREDVQQAAQTEQEILEALEQLQRNVNKGLDDLQALTLAQRLRKIASDEQSLAGRLKRIIPEIIGLLPNELPARFKQSESVLATDQEATQKESVNLYGEIGRFFERTQKEAYGQVHKHMTETKVNDDLDRIRGLIQENISMDAAQTLALWSDRFKSWADLLEPPESPGGGGGGGGGGEGGESNEALLKVLLGLLRVRDREVNVRQRTALVEQRRAENEAYLEAVKSIAGTQAQVRDALSNVQGENPLPALEFPLQEIVDSMQEVEDLLNKPQTDRTTDLAQTKAIEQLSDLINLINEQQQRSRNSSSSQSASAEEMAFLMEMMAQQANQGQGMMNNPQGGGNTAGGTTDRAAAPALGNPNGRAGEERTVERAGGSTATAPTEFREALEDFYRAVEQLDSK